MPKMTSEASPELRSFAQPKESWILKLRLAAHKCISAWGALQAAAQADGSIYFL